MSIIDQWTSSTALCARRRSKSISSSVISGSKFAEHLFRLKIWTKDIDGCSAIMAETNFHSRWQFMVKSDSSNRKKKIDSFLFNYKGKNPSGFTLRSAFFHTAINTDRKLTKYDQEEMGYFSRYQLVLLIFDLYSFHPKKLEVGLAICFRWFSIWNFSLIAIRYLTELYDGVGALGEWTISVLEEKKNWSCRSSALLISSVNRYWFLEIQPYHQLATCW